MVEEAPESPAFADQPDTDTVAEKAAATGTPAAKKAPAATKTTAAKTTAAKTTTAAKKATAVTEPHDEAAPATAETDEEADGDA